MRQPVKREMSGVAIARMLRPYSDELDRVLAQLDSGLLSHRQFDELEHRAHEIAVGIRSAFRKGGSVS